MKKLTTVVLGLSLVLGTVAFAQGTDTKGADTTTTTKKKTKKSKKSKTAGAGDTTGTTKP